MKIFIDAGHNYSGWNTGAEGNGLREQDINYAVSKALGDVLKLFNGTEVKLSRNSPTENLGSNQATALAERYNGANNWGADLFISVHCNAFSNSSANGTETMYKRDDCKELATKMSAGISKALSLTNRGIVYRGDLAVLNGTRMPAILIELAFITNPAEAAMLKDRQQDFADAIAGVLGEHYNLGQQAVGTAIIGEPSASAGQMKAWAEKKNSAAFFVGLADIYCKIAGESGVDPVAAYCQSAFETGYGTFKNGLLDESYHNPCGLKTTEGGSDTDRDAHMRFETWEQGISAQLDHLALYAGADGYPKAVTDDPRHFPFIFGTARTVESLSGKWAVSPADYGVRIAEMMKQVAAVEPQPEEPQPEEPKPEEPKPEEPQTEEPSDWAVPAWTWAKENKIILGGEPRAAATREQVAQMLYAAFENLINK